MKTFLLEAELWLPRPPEEIFPFFGDAGNLERITPPWVNFQILTPLPIEMKPGALIDYKLRLRGVPIRWRTEITEWEPPFRFVDEQLRGPYRLWRHEHTFEERDGGTLARDRVEYAVPFGRLANWLIVRRDLDKIFAYRQEQIKAAFPENA